MQLEVNFTAAFVGSRGATLHSYKYKEYERLLQCRDAKNSCLHASNFWTKPVNAQRFAGRIEILFNMLISQTRFP